MGFSVNSKYPQAKIIIDSGNKKTDTQLLDSLLAELNMYDYNTRQIEYNLTVNRSNVINIFLETLMDKTSDSQMVYHMADTISKITRICKDYNDNEMITEFVPNRNWNACNNLIHLIKHKESKYLRSVKKTVDGFQIVFSKNYDVSVYDIDEKKSKKILDKKIHAVETELNRIQRQIVNAWKKITIPNKQNTTRKKTKTSTRKIKSKKETNRIYLKKLYNRKVLLEQTLKFVPNQATTKIESPY